MPLEIRVIGTVEAASTVAVRAQITGELTSVNFKEGDDVQKGQVLFTLDRRPLEAALQQAEANLERDIGAGGQRASAGEALPGSRRSAASRRASRSTRRRRDAAALEATRRRRPRGGREREGPAAVRDDHRADRRPHRRADGARRQPRARQRHDAARRHQPGHADLRLVRDSRSAAAGAEALHGAGHAAASRRSRPTTTARRRSAASRSSTTRSIRRPARSRSRARSRTRTPALARPVRQRRR